MAEFHCAYFEPEYNELEENKMCLYVDYSTCNKLGQHSSFFQKVSESLINKTTSYYSIKGSKIIPEDLTTHGVYTLLRNIQEVNYAELAEAARRITDNDCETVLITDGEYYTPSIAKGHENDPYLAEAFKKWILKGHDIHIISEPYVEPYHGKNFQKKRFYILFTDDRMQNNIYERILRTVDLTEFPQVDEFHISASHPQLKGNGNNSSTQNEYLLCKAHGYGTFEIQDWNGADWKTIEQYIVYASDNQTGEPLENGSPIIQMGLDRNSFGCYKICSVKLKTYSINQAYQSFYEDENTENRQGLVNDSLIELENFMVINQDEFEKHSKIDIKFNQAYFDPSSFLSGEPYNYFKIDILIDKILPIFSKHEDMFIFESISQQGMKNESVASSIRQCLADDKLIDMMRNQVIYTIYIKSESK